MKSCSQMLERQAERADPVRLSCCATFYKHIAWNAVSTKVRPHASGPDGVSLLAALSCHLGLRSILNLDGRRCCAATGVAMGALHPGVSRLWRLLVFLLCLSRLPLGNARLRTAGRA